MIQFVTADSVQLPLEDGEHIVVKRRLSHGESDDMMARMLPHLDPTQFGGLQVESKGVRTAKVLAYLIGWSAAVPYALDMTDDARIDTINALDPDSFNEIERAILAHEARVDAERAEKKRARAGALAFAPTSELVAP